MYVCTFINLNSPNTMAFISGNMHTKSSKQGLEREYVVIKYLIFYCLSDSYACEYIIQIGVLGYYYLFVVQRISTVYYYYYFHPHHNHQAKQQHKRVCVFERIILMPGKLNDFLFSLSVSNMLFSVILFHRIGSTNQEVI